MPRSSRHKSHKQSKHSSRDYSDSDEDVMKMKEKSSKDENSVRSHRDSASGEKRRISSQVREGKESKDLSCHGNGDIVEEYASSKRRKEKTDVTVSGGRWNGGGDDRGDSDRNVEKEMQKVDCKVKETSNKGENLRIDSKSKSRWYESGVSGERKEDSLASVVMEENKSKGESKKKSERDYSSRKEGKESKDKDRRVDNKKNGGQESNSGDAEVKFADVDDGKKQGPMSGDFTLDRQGKRARENTERTLLDDARNSELEKDSEKKGRRKREGSSEKHYDDYREGVRRRSSSKGDRANDVKYGDDMHKDGGYADKYNKDVQKDDRRDEKHRDEADRDYKYQYDKYQEDGKKDTRHRDDRHREDGDRDSRRKGEKYCEDGERDNKRKDVKSREGTERDIRRGDKSYEDGDKDNRRKDERYHDYSEKDIRRGDERYHDVGDRDDRRRDHSYKDDGDRDYRHKEDKYRDDAERDTRHKVNKQGDGFDREKKPRDTKYRDERTSRDRSGDKSDLKRSEDDGYIDQYARKPNTYDDSPTHDDRAARYQDDQARRRTNKKEDYGDIKYRAANDQRSDADKKIANSARMDTATDRGRSSSRNADLELTSGHGRRRTSPTSNSHMPRDHHRALKQDESKYRDYNYEDRHRPSTRDHTGAGERSENTSSRSIENLAQKDDGIFREQSAERRLTSDIRSSPMHQVDKSPSSGSDRRQFNKSDVIRSIDLEESTQRRGGSRDLKDYSGRDGRGSQDAMDVLPGEELLPADADTLSVSSPFARNSHFSSCSKSMLPPPPFRTGIDSPVISGSGDDDGRGKSNTRYRRIGDPNMGRIQGNTWRGVPSWHSSVANGFLPFPHAPPTVGFPSVMQPFPAPPIFGVRPSMELNHPGAYRMPDADMFACPGRPMAWRNQVQWDVSTTVFGDETPFYGRSDWDHSRNLHGSRGWETSGDFLRGPNRTESLEMPFSEKENNSVQSGDEDLTDQSIQPAKNEQIQVDQPTDGIDITQPVKNIEKNDVEALISIPEDIGDVSKMSKKDDVRLFHVYLSKLDISADLTEPELFCKCTALIDTDQSISSDVDDSKILYIEDNTVSYRLLNNALFGSTDDSVFQKSMSLYERQKKHLRAKGGEKVPSDFVLNSNQEDINIADGKTESAAPPNSDNKVEPMIGAQISAPVGITAENSEDQVSSLEHVTRAVSSILDLGPLENDAEVSTERVEGSDAPELKNVPLESSSNNEEPKLVLDTNCDHLLNSDMFLSEASEAIVPGSVNLSRIHHSPESTH